MIRATLALTMLLVAACGAELDEQCDPTSDPGNCDWFGGYACVSCESHGYGTHKGYCYFDDATDTSYAHICEEAWGPATGDESGGGGGSCGGDINLCYSAWTGEPNDQAKYNCQAACAERASCNEPGVTANCDILRGYGVATVSSCTTCR